MAAVDQPVTLYLRNVPARLVRDAKTKAAREGTTLTAVVVDALTRALESPAGSRHPGGDSLHDSSAWYEANRPRLLRRYPGEFVAIVNRAVVDHDARFDALATRVFARFGPVPIFMPRVTAEDESVRVRSPRRRTS